MQRLGIRKFNMQSDYISPMLAVRRHHDDVRMTCFGHTEDGEDGNRRCIIRSDSAVRHGERNRELGTSATHSHHDGGSVRSGRVDGGAYGRGPFPRYTARAPREHRQPPDLYPMNRCVLSTALPVCRNTNPHPNPIQPLAWVYGWWGKRATAGPN